MRNYNLGFITNQAIYKHVEETVLKYRFNVDLVEFNKNLVDPIKLTFDSKVYKRSIDLSAATGPRRRRPARCDRGRGRSHDDHAPRPGEQVRVPATPFRQAQAVPCRVVKPTLRAITGWFAVGVTAVPGRRPSRSTIPHRTCGRTRRSARWSP